MSDRGTAVEGSSYSNFAGIFLFVVGLFNILDGVITLWRKEYFSDASVVFANMQTWGWIVLVIGIVQVLAGWLVLSRSSVGRWVGIIVVVISMMASFMAIGVYPFWTFIILAVDAMVLWGLTGRWQD
jgi:multisubunit Na+/H+ antiporter MnhG subunit